MPGSPASCNPLLFKSFQTRLPIDAVPAIIERIPASISKFVCAAAKAIVAVIPVAGFASLPVATVPKPCVVKVKPAGILLNPTV